MSSRHDPCPRCEQVPFYDDHLPWCKAITELEERIEQLEDQIKGLREKVFPE